jgi:large subunit ribosomal protein L10
VAGSAFDIASDQIGPLIYGFSVDAVAAAKVVADPRRPMTKLVPGAFGGKLLSVDAGGLKLANIPSKEVI